MAEVCPSAGIRFPEQYISSVDHVNLWPAPHFHRAQAEGGIPPVRSKFLFQSTKGHADHGLLSGAA